jgi:hypothetical protein
MIFIMLGIEKYLSNFDIFDYLVNIDCDPWTKFKKVLAHFLRNHPPEKTPEFYYDNILFLLFKIR